MSFALVIKIECNGREYIKEILLNAVNVYCSSNVFACKELFKRQWAPKCEQCQGTPGPHRVTLRVSINKSQAVSMLIQEPDDIDHFLHTPLLPTVRHLTPTEIRETLRRRTGLQFAM